MPAVHIAGGARREPARGTLAIGTRQARVRSARRKGRITMTAALYPVFLKLDGLPVVIVGGGNVAASKLDGLLAAGARVTVIAPQVRDEIRAKATVIEETF